MVEYCISHNQNSRVYKYDSDVLLISGYFRQIIQIFEKFKSSASPESWNIWVWISEFHSKLIPDWAGLNGIDPVWAQIKNKKNC